MLGAGMEVRVSRSFIGLDLRSTEYICSCPINQIWVEPLG